MPDMHTRRPPPGRLGPDLSRKSDVRSALRRQIDENLRAAFGAVLDEPCPDHLARLLGQLAASPEAPGRSDEDGSEVTPP